MFHWLIAVAVVALDFLVSSHVADRGAFSWMGLANGAVYGIDIVRPGDGTVQISADVGGGGVQYYLQETTDLPDTNAWANVQGPLTAPGAANLNFTDPNPTEAGKFYRVLAQ